VVGCEGLRGKTTPPFDKLMVPPLLSQEGSYFGNNALVSFVRMQARTQSTKTINRPVCKLYMTFIFVWRLSAAK